MSRIGNKIITVDDSVKLNIEPGIVTATGINGSLSIKVPNNINIEQKDNQVFVKILAKNSQSSREQGLVRSLLANIITGVTKGFQKKLIINGVGYRATVEGDTLVLNVGYSHPVNIIAPEDITFTVQKNIITVSGKDKQSVGQVAAKIREVRKPEPYKGKGIKYSTEKIKRKAGKASKASEA